MERTAEVQRLQEHGCSVLCLDCPEGMLFGIDYAAFTVGPRFMGVKLIPPGMHYIYTSGSSQDIGISRTGFFLHMRPQEVAVFRWDPVAEELARPDNADEEARYADGVRGFDFDSHLGPYPLDLSEPWIELTRHASPHLVSKIEPVGKVLRSKRAEYDAASAAMLAAQQANEEQAAEAEAAAMEADEDEDEEAVTARLAAAEAAAAAAAAASAAAAAAKQQPDDRSQQQADSQLESNLGAGTLFFSAVPRSRKTKGATPAETTHLHMDRSEQLSQMLTKEYGGDETGILGELQIAFVAFILGQNYDGFEQWRSLLALLCSCEAAVPQRSGLFAELCRVFFAQLSQAPSDLFGDDLTKDNFLGSCAVGLLEICDADGLPAKLRKRCGKLRELVEQKFGISAEDLALLGDDAPVFVDLEGKDLVRLGDEDFDHMD